MKERKTISQRKILDVMAQISFEKNTAIAKNNTLLANTKEVEFNRLIGRAKKLGYSSVDIIKSDLFGQINASHDAGNILAERFFQAFLLQAFFQNLYNNLY